MKLNKLQTRYGNSRYVFVWRNGPKSLVLLEVNTLNVLSRFDNFWAVGYLPKLICCTRDGHYAIGVSVSHRNTYLSIGWKIETSNTFQVKKIEMSSKEKWIGIDFNTRETCLTTCYIIDTKGARVKSVNSEIYPIALVFTLYNYSLGNMSILDSQEFFDNRLQDASIMRRHEMTDIFFVGSIGTIGAFILNDSNKITMLTTLEGFGDFKLSDIFIQNNYLLLVREDPHLTYPIVYYNIDKAGDIEESFSETKEAAPEEREDQITSIKEAYLQPDIRLHSVQKFKEEMDNHSSMLYCTTINSIDILVVGNIKGISYMVKKEARNMNEVAISGTGNYMI